MVKPSRFLFHQENFMICGALVVLPREKRGTNVISYFLTMQGKIASYHLNGKGLDAFIRRSGVR